MSDTLPTPDDADREDGFDAVLVEILEAEDAGRPRDPAYWVARFPHYRAGLLEYFADRTALTGGPAGGPRPLPEFPGHEVIRELGRGGMGVVYEARQVDPKRTVALKALPAARLLTPVERVRFRREARVAARLDHPHIIPVYEIGEATGVPFYTMKLATGGPLSRALDRYRADPTAAARLVARLARAVHFAHQRGILHRDLKPSNILLDEDGRGYVSDFGLVRDLADPDPLTRTAELVGTPAFMTPEQAAGKGAGVTVATDVYGLGTVLYVCLTGRPLFADPNPAVVLRKVQQTEPDPPARVNPRVPRDLDAVCRMALDKDPGKRYPSAAELAADLDRFLDHEPVRAKPAGPGRRLIRWAARNPLPAALAVLTSLAVVAAAGLGAWAWDQNREARLAREAGERDRFFAGLERVRQRRDDPYAPWSRQSLSDLRELAALAPAREHLPELRTEAAAALAAGDPEPGPLLADFRAYASHYSTDGKRLAVAAWDAGRVELTEVATGERRTLTFPPDPGWEDRAGRPDGARSVKFSPNRRWLVVGTRSGRLVRWDLTDPAAAPLTWDAHTADDPDPHVVRVLRLGFTVDGGLLSGSFGVTRRWSVADGRPAGLDLPGVRLPLDFYPVANVMTVFLADEKGSDYGRLQLDARAAPDRRFPGRPGGCLGPDPQLLAYRPDGATGVCVRYADPNARPRPLERWEDPTEPDQLTFNPAGDRLAAVYEHEQSLRVWDVPSGALLAERLADGQAPHATFHPDGGRLVVSGTAGARAYDFPHGVLDTVAIMAEPEVVAMAAPADHAEVAAVGVVPPFYPRLYRVPLGPGRPAAHQRGGTLGWCWTVSPWADYGPDGPILAGRRRPAEKGEAPGPVEVRLASGWLPAPDLCGLRSGPDGRLWVLGEHRVRLVATPDDAPDVWRNDPAAEEAGHALKSVAPGRGFALVGRRDGWVFRVEPGAGMTASWRVMDSAVRSLAVSPDGTRAVAGGERGEVRLLDLQTGTVAEVPDAHRAAVPAVALGPGLLVTGSDDRRVRLWTPAGEQIATLRMRGPVAKVLLSADESSLLVHVRGERAVRRWRLDELFREWAALGLAAGGG